MALWGMLALWGVMALWGPTQQEGPFYLMGLLTLQESVHGIAAQHLNPKL